MHILHVTPHLPPDQAANALLPCHLGEWAKSRGDAVEYVAHPPRASGRIPLPGPVTWIARRSGRLHRSHPARRLSPGRGEDGAAPSPPVSPAPTSSTCTATGCSPELAVLLARRRGIPVVLTLYGTEIWHYTRKRFRPDLFTRAYRGASQVTFYSDRLMSRAFELGLGRRDARVIYPPVGAEFVWHGEDAQANEREALGIANRHMLLNVKRLHPLAGQRILIEAMADVLHAYPDTRLIICGAGTLLEELQSAARSAGAERHVTFAGLVDNATVARYCAAADVFVLPSRLEALPTVAVEALACGTPVVSSDNPGGLELNALFGPDVSIVPGEQPIALARAIVYFLEHKRRTLSGTRETIEREFSAAAVDARYRAVYESAVQAREADAS